MNKTRTITTKLTMVAFLFAMVLLLMPMNTFAAKKPGQVKNIEEVKATDHSITFKFKKVKGAKSYQVRVYEAKRKSNTRKTTNKYGEKKYVFNYTWNTSKKLVKEMSTKNTTCTIKGLGEKGFSKSYAIKVRACNGKSYGKWETQYMWTTFEGKHNPGKSAATGENLKKQYERWRKPYVDDAKNNPKEGTNCTGLGYALKCTERVLADIENPEQYSKKEVYETYKRGYGTDLEIYHVVIDACKEAGVKNKIWRHPSYKKPGCICYSLVLYDGKEESTGEAFDIKPGVYFTSSWSDESAIKDGWQ